jgi:hypothetical protein
MRREGDRIREDEKPKRKEVDSHVGKSFGDSKRDMQVQGKASLTVRVRQEGSIRERREHRRETGSKEGRQGAKMHFPDYWYFTWSSNFLQRTLVTVLTVLTKGTPD